MQRRELIAVLGGAAIAWPLASRAQQVSKKPRIGYFMDRSGPELFDEAFLVGRAKMATLLARMLRSSSDGLKARPKCSPPWQLTWSPAKWM